MKLRVFILCMTLGLVSSQIALASTAPMDERSVKVAYIYNFLRLTEWPTSPEEPFRLCVLGQSSLDQELALLNGKPVLSQVHIEIIRTTEDNLSNCQAVYVGERDRHKLNRILTQLAQAPVLTLTDVEGLADRGVMIEMNTRQNRVVFEINLRVARQVNLNFNTRLLKLAHYVSS